MVADEALTLITRAIALDPYDPFLRRACADRLQELGDDPAAKVQLWVADLLDGKRRYQLVFTRRGLLTGASERGPKLRTQDRNYWLGVATRVLEEQPDAAFVIIEKVPMTNCGLRAEKPPLPGSGTGFVSPVLFYRSNWKPWGGAKNRQTPRVVPGPTRAGKRWRIRRQ